MEGGVAGPGFWCHTYVAVKVENNIIQANSISYISRMLY